MTKYTKLGRSDQFKEVITAVGAMWMSANKVEILVATIDMVDNPLPLMKTKRNRSITIETDEGY